MGSTSLRSLWVPGACGIALVMLLAAGGAAARPGGTLLGIPSLAAALAVAVAVTVLAGTERGRTALSASTGLLVPVALLLAGLPVVGLRALSGPPLFALALAGLAIAATASRWRPPGWVFLPAVFLLYTLASARVQLQVGPRGDEPHYLMVADSLLHDRDLSLEADYAARRYAGFHDAPLAPHYRVRGRGGEIYSLHAVGLSILILPAYALAGYAGASLFLALLAALLARELRESIRGLSGRESLADGVGWALALSPPLLHYAGLVFTEVPAALAVAFALRRSREPRLGTGATLAVGLAASALPWLNVRYAPVAALLLLHALWRHRRAWPGLLGPALVSAVGILLYHHLLYGFLDPRRVYGRRPEMSLATLGEGLPGLLLDQEFGVFIYAPVLALAVPGLVLLFRRDRRLALTSVALMVVVVLTAGTWHMWRGGFNPPGRFLVPLVPVVALAVAAVWDRRGLTAGAALLLGWSLWTGLAGAWEPRLVHRDRDDTAPFFRRHAGAREWTTLLPGYVLSEPDRHHLAAVWVVGLVLALPWRTRTVTAARVAAAALGLVAAAQAAATLSDARTGGRDAVRLVGRKALAVPGWRIVEAPAEWGPGELDLGPVYEPHRHPEGAEIGSRLALPSGHYRLEIGTEDLAPAMPPPVLEVRPDGGGVARVGPLRRGPVGLEGEFAVTRADGAVTLRLRGGGPLRLQAVRLLVQPYSRGAV